MEKLLQNVPNKPGVYRFLDAKNNVLYVGKAKDLSKRVRSYFQKGQQQSMRIKKMLSQVSDISCTVAGSELEALILETNLIKELQPKYNVLMRDDKNYVYIKVTANEDYPRVSVVRKVEKDGSKYFGPKLASSKVWKTLDVLKKLFPFRTCALDIVYEGKPHVEQRDLFDANRPSLPVKISKKIISVPCLYYAIKRCPAPCIGKITPLEYQAIMKRAVEFLEGKTDVILQELRADMQKAAENRHFERAGNLRDIVFAIEEISERQRVSEPVFGKQDVVSFITDHGKAYFTLFMIRDGKLVNQENFLFDAIEARRDSDSLDVSEMLQSFLAQYYKKAIDFPQEVVIPDDIEDRAVFEKWLNIKIVVPKQGKKYSLIELATTNAKQFAVQWRVKWMSDESKIEKALKELSGLLGITKPLHRIECYDVSHFAGTQTVASMVVFEDGQPKEKDYRKFKIQLTPNGKPDDVLSIAEVLERRLRRLGKKLHSCVRPAQKRDRTFLSTFFKKFSLRSIVVFEEEGKCAGFGRIVTHQKRLQEIFVHALPKRLDIQAALLQDMLAKVRGKKIYILVRQADIPFYEGFHFHETKDIPKELKKRAKKGFSALVHRPKKEKSDTSFQKQPDFIVVDGGKPQLSTAQRVLERLHLDIPLISLAKREEEIFAPGRDEPLKLSRDSSALQLVQYMRDEAHRFALQYQTVRRGNDAIASELDILHGIGPRLKMKLLRHFGSLSGIRRASFAALSHVVSKKVAEEVKTQLC